MTYSCWCCLSETEKDGEAEYEKYVELPFVPFVDLEIVFSDEDSFFVDRIAWSVDDKVFLLYSKFGGAEIWCKCGPEDGCCILDTSHFVEQGWEVKEVRRGYERRNHHPEMFDPEKHFLSDLAPQQVGES